MYRRRPSFVSSERKSASNSPRDSTKWAINERRSKTRCVLFSRFSPSQFISQPPFCAATRRLVRSHAPKIKKTMSRLKAAISRLKIANIVIDPSSRPPSRSNRKSPASRVALSRTKRTEGLLKESVENRPSTFWASPTSFGIVSAIPSRVGAHGSSATKSHCPSGFCKKSQNSPCCKRSDSNFSWSRSTKSSTPRSTISQWMPPVNFPARRREVLPPVDSVSSLRASSGLSPGCSSSAVTTSSLRSRSGGDSVLRTE